MRFRCRPCMHWAVLMDNIRLTRNLLDQGYNWVDLRRLQRDGELVRVRRGAYCQDEKPGEFLEERHRRLILATAPQLRDGAVFSHGSAAVMHGLPVWSEAVARVHVTRDRRGKGIKRSVVQVNGAPLQPSEIVLIDNIPATSLARTVLDLARTVPMTQAVSAGDRALALGLTRQELQVGLLLMERWPGVRAARRVVEFLDARSESAGESMSRVRLMEEGLPRPELQQEIFGPDGRLVARVDFRWKEYNTVGEFDGKIKYGRLLKPGQRIEDVIFEEKVREDAVRDLGLQVVRWISRDLYRPGVLRERVLRAFARAT
jgi:alkylated DNA nucleotide flippase Atl1